MARLRFEIFRKHLWLVALFMQALNRAVGITGENNALEFVNKSMHCISAANTSQIRPITSIIKFFTM